MEYTAPQVRALVEWLLIGDETLSEAWFGSKKPLGPLAQKVLELSKKKGWSKARLKALEVKLGGMDENSPLGKNVLQQTLLTLGSGGFDTLAKSKEKS
jgi:hypothetical protein